MKKYKMSKSIYEDAFNHLDELVDALAHIEGSFLYRHYLDNIRLKLKQAQKQEKLIQKLKSNLISGHFEDKFEHTNKDDLSKMYNKGLYDMVNAIEEYILQEFKELEMVELVKYIFRYSLVPARNAKMIGDHEWSEYVYIGDSPEIEVQKVEATEEDVNHLFGKLAKLPDFDLEDYCGGLDIIKDYLGFKLKNSYNTEREIVFEVYTITKGDCIIELLNKHDEVYVEMRLKEELK